MRFLPVFLPAVVAAAALHPAVAQELTEKRTFIIASSYGADRCLTGDLACGAPAASAYCQAREFSTASSYRRIGRDEITGAVSSSAACGRHGCEELIAIECSR